MKLIKMALASIAMLASVVAVAAPAAAAQGTNVVVIDQQRIMGQSAGGKDIISKVNSIEASMQAELQPTQDALSSESAEIEAKTANMTRQAVAADETLRTQIQTFAAKAQKFEQDRKIAAAELQATERKAWSDFFTAMQPVLSEVVAEKNADILIDRSDAIFATKAIDATDLVITKMDAKMPTVTVVRQKMPTQPQQQ